MTDPTQATLAEAMTIPADLVPYIRHCLHLQLGRECEGLEAAAKEQGDLTDFGAAGPPLPIAYRDALKHFDRIRALLDVLGWDLEADAGDVKVDLRRHADALYVAVDEESEDLRENALGAKEGPPPREVAEVYLRLRDMLETLDGRIEVRA